MQLHEALTGGIQNYELDVSGIQVMPVYWITAPDYADGFKGAKPSPTVLQAEVDRIVSECAQVDEEINVRDPASARNFLYRNRLGIDCSGFVYHVIDHVLLDSLGQSFSSHLFVPRDTIIQAANKPSWKSAHELTKAERDELPPIVPLDWVCKTFDKDPASQVNAARLCNDIASSEVTHFEEVRAGDLIHMRKNGKSKHVTIVSQVSGSEWEVWDSYREDGGYGGVMPHSVEITAPTGPLQAQLWSDFDTNRYDDYVIRRPHVFET